MMSLLNDADHQMLTTDATLTVTNTEGRPQVVLPYRLGIQHPIPPRGSAQHIPRTISGAGPQLALIRPTAAALSAASGVSVAAPSPTKVMPPPTPPSTTRPAPNGTPRLPTAQLSNGPLPTPSQVPLHSSPPPSINGVSAVTEHDVKMTSPVKPSPSPLPQLELSQPTPEVRISPMPTNVSLSPTRPKSITQMPSPLPSIPNGYHLAPVNGYPSHLSAASPYAHPVRSNQLSAQQMQSLKVAYQNVRQAADGSMQAAHLAMRSPANPAALYMQNTGDPQYTAQLAAARQMQWAVAQRAPTVTMVDPNTAALDASLAASLSQPLNASPARVPPSPANGVRSINRGIPSPSLAHAMSSPQGRGSPVTMGRLTAHSPTPHLLSPSMAAAQIQSSPTRQPQAPPMPSPSLQSRQMVGNSGTGY